MKHAKFSRVLELVSPTWTTYSGGYVFSNTRNSTEQIFRQSYLLSSLKL